MSIEPTLETPEEFRWQRPLSLWKSEYDARATDPEGLASAMDRLMETVLSTPGIMEEYGDPRIGEFFVAGSQTLEKAGSACEPDSDAGLKVRRRWALYCFDTDSLLTTQVYSSYQRPTTMQGRSTTCWCCRCCVKASPRNRNRRPFLGESTTIRPAD